MNGVQGEFMAAMSGTFDNHLSSLSGYLAACLLVVTEQKMDRMPRGNTRVNKRECQVSD